MDQPPKVSYRDNIIFFPVKKIYVPKQFKRVDSVLQDTSHSPPPPLLTLPYSSDIADAADNFVRGIQNPKL